MIKKSSQGLSSNNKKKAGIAHDDVATMQATQWNFSERNRQLGNLKQLI